MKKSRWKTALKTIYELAPYKDVKTAGMTPEDVLSHMQLDFPDITRQDVFSGVPVAINNYGAPIETQPDPKKARGVLYYVPLGARKKAHSIMAGSQSPRRAEPGGVTHWQKVTAILLERVGRPAQIGTIMEEFKKEFPEAEQNTVYSAISGASITHAVPICKKSVRGGIWYFIRIKDYGVSSEILTKCGVCLPPGANSLNTPARQIPVTTPPPTVKGAIVPVCAASGAGVDSRFTAPKTTATIRSENCLYLIQARAPRSLSCEDVADFFFIPLEEAAQVLTAAAAKYGHLVEITMHARIKKQ